MFEFLEENAELSWHSLLTAHVWIWHKLTELTEKKVFYLQRLPLITAILLQDWLLFIINTLQIKHDSIIALETLATFFTGSLLRAAVGHTKQSHKWLPARINGTDNSRLLRGRNGSPMYNDAALTVGCDVTMTTQGSMQGLMLSRMGGWRFLFDQKVSVIRFK